MKKIQNVFAAIKTGLLSKATSITVIGSKSIIEFLKTFEKDGLIRGFQIVNLKTCKICIYLKYKQDKTSFISSIKSVSDTKQKMYLKGSAVKKIKNTLNIYFIATKAGLSTLPQLKIYNKRINNDLGGEVKYIVEINKVSNKLNELIKK